MADEVISKVRVPDGTSNIYVLKDEISRSRTEYEQVTKSGNPLVLETGGQSVDNLVLNMEPIQDLHGYDHPWAGGAGKNLLPLTVVGFKAANTSGTWNGNTYTGVNGGKFTILTDSGGNVAGIKTEKGTNESSILLSFTLPSGSYVLSSGVEEVIFRDDTYLAANGSTIARGNSSSPGQSFALNESTNVTFCIRTRDNNFTFYPMIRLSTVSDATFEPYSNICPISGHTEADVKVTGKNLANFLDNKNIDSSGVVFDSSGRIATVDPIVIEDGVSYIVKVFGAATSAIYAVWNGDTLVRRAIQNFGTPLNTDGGDRFYVCVYRDVAITVESTKAMVVKSTDTVTSYEPYQSKSVTVQLGQTVYGGTYNFTTGELVVDKSYMAVPHMTEFTGAKNAYVEIDSIKRMTDYRGEIICDKLKTVEWADDSVTYSNNWISAYPYSTAYKNKNWLYVHVESTATLSNVNNWIDENQPMLCYPLATPLTYTLTPQQLKTLVGTNIFTSENGTVEVTIRDGLFMLAGEEVGGDTDSEVANITLYAADWSNSIYTISDARITDTSIQEFIPAIGITDDQLKALHKADIQDGGQDTGHAYLRAYGTVPSIDIPIQAIFNRGSKAVDVNMNYSISEIEVPVSGWSSSTTTIDGTNYYTQTISVTNVEIAHPEIQLGASGTLPTAAEKAAYSCLDYVTVDIQNSSMTFYAETKPASTFIVIVEGVYA